MHTVTLIARSLLPEQREPLPETPHCGVCCVTGTQTDTIASKHLIGGLKFCDGNLFAAPESSRIGIDVWYAWKYGAFGKTDDGEDKKRKRTPEMQACWFCDGIRFIDVGKAEVRRFAIAGVPLESQTHWACYVTRSYKKHGSLRSPVNVGKFGIIGFDDQKVDLRENVKVREWWSVLREAQTQNVGRKSIETANCPVMLREKIGIVFWMKFEQWAKARVHSPLYQFLAYLLPSHDELTAGYSDANLFD